MLPGLILAPALVAGVSATLALLITIIDALVNNYGELDIDINKGKKQLRIKGGANLLVTLAESGIFVPSACGGRGSCGACKCKITTDVGPHLPTEIPYLNAEELQNNVHLSCQVKVKKALSIELPDELFSIKRFDAVVERIQTVTHDIKEVLFKLEKPSTIEFKAGQYIQIYIPPYGNQKEGTQRAYSMSSRPIDSGHVELLVRLVPGGIATTWVHTVLTVGAKVNLVGPFGDFMVRDTDAVMVCVAGGSGMAPFKSIFYDFAEKAAMNREIWYFFGARSARDLFYLDELRKLEKQHPNFHFIPALSEPQPTDNWSGETGLITQVLDRYLREKIQNTKPREGYLCGSPGMLDACIAVMKKNGMNEKTIYFDKF